MRKNYIKIFKSQKDLQINIKDFPNKSKVLIVTGLSGSGKSYCADQIAKEYGATHFQIEWLIHTKHITEECSFILNSFFEKHPEIVELAKNKWNNCKNEDENDLLKEYINKFFIHFLEVKDPNKLYIVEGLQLFTLIDYKSIKDFPIIIKGTSSIDSLKNRLKRDLSKPKNKKLIPKIKYFFKALLQSRLYQFKHRKRLNSFIWNVFEDNV